MLLDVYHNTHLNHIHFYLAFTRLKRKHLFPNASQVGWDIKSFIFFDCAIIHLLELVSSSRLSRVESAVRDRNLESARISKEWIESFILIINVWTVVIRIA